MQPESNGVFTSLASLAASRRPVSIRARRPNQRSTGALPGETASRVRGAGKTFEEIRPYLPGDDIRHIDWRVTARSNVTQLRVYAADRERPVQIVADQRANMFFGSRGAFKSVTCAQCAAIVAWHHAEIGEPVGGQVITNGQILGQSARRSAAGAIRTLQLINMANQQCNQSSEQRFSLDDALKRATVRIRSGTHLVFISDWHDYDKQCETTIRRVAQHRPVTLIQVTEPLENALPANSMLGISNGFDRVRVHISRVFSSHYQNEVARAQDLFDATARIRGVRCIKVSTLDTTAQLIDQLVANE